MKGNSLLRGLLLAIPAALAATLRHQPHATPTTPAQQAQVASGRPAATPPQVTTEQSFDQLRDWHQRITAQRTNLNLTDQSAVVEFNREAARYHEALHRAQRAVAPQPTFVSLPPTSTYSAFPASSYPTALPTYFAPRSYSYPSYGTTTTDVSGYTRTNGTYVPPHLRTTADQTTTNNWSHTGNINPVTGAKGYHR